MSQTFTHPHTHTHTNTQTHLLSFFLSVICCHNTTISISLGLHSFYFSSCLCHAAMLSLSLPLSSSLSFSHAHTHTNPSTLPSTHPPIHSYICTHSLTLSLFTHSLLPFNDFWQWNHFLTRERFIIFYNGAKNEYIICLWLALIAPIWGWHHKDALS